MEDKKGFTLIELLAVIVILAIIALISTPIVLNIIKNSEKEAFKNSIYNLVRTIELDTIANGAKYPKSYVLTGNEITPTISLSGKLDAYGEITIEQNGKTKVQVDNGKWCAKKEAEQTKLTISSSPCTDNPIIIREVKVTPKWTEGLQITASTISSSSNIISYQFNLKQQNKIIASSEEIQMDQYTFTFDKLSNNEQYQIEVIVKDDQGHTQQTTIKQDLAYNPIISRYIVVDIYESLGGDSIAINELEFLDANNQKLPYTVEAVYDTTTGGDPFYWTDSRYWQKEHLYDGKVNYTSNIDGGSTSTLFLYDNSPSVKEGSWARFLVDFGQEKEIKAVNLWTGGTDNRQPHIIKMYQYSSEIDENFVQTYIKTKNETLPCVYEKTFNENYLVPTKDTNYLIFPKDTEAPKVTSIKTDIQIESLILEAETKNVFYAPPVKQYRYALIKDNNQLTSNQITIWSEFQSSPRISYDVKALEEGTYYIYTEVIDTNSKTTFHVSQPYQFRKNKLKKQYIIMEVYDHLAVDGAVITEIEFYDDSNQKIPYEIAKVYDSLTKSDPTCWNDGLWQKEHLYDGIYHYASNADGSTTSTILNYPSSPNQGIWTRMVFDFSSEKIIDQLKIWLGSPEGRLAKEIHFYVTDNKDIESIYNQNIIQRENNGLKEITELIFTTNIYTVRPFETTDIQDYIFEKI